MKTHEKRWHIVLIFTISILGGVAKFDIRVVGKPEPVVEWFKNGKQIEDQGRFVIIDEVDEQDKELFSLVIEQCKPDDDSEYMVVAMNEAGKDTSTCHLFVTPKPITEDLTIEEEPVLEQPIADIIDSAMPGISSSLQISNLN